MSTVTAAEYEWREWRLGEGRYRGAGYPQGKPKRKSIYGRPTVIERPVWFARLAAFLARRKLAQSKPVTLGPFARPGALYRAHNGGVENVAAAKAAGLSWALLCLDEPPAAWADLGHRFDQHGIPWGYWYHCRTLWDLEWLLERSHGRPIVGINVEKELETVLSPAVVADAVKRSGYTGQVATVLLGWVGDTDCRPIGHWPALLEIFPQDAADLWPPYVKVHHCLEHARIRGLRAPLQLMGCYDDDQLGEAHPGWYDRSIPNHVFTVDDTGERWMVWGWS